ncbi:hypothetical protein SGLAD_v1c08580 [Spiroplasma gladiatoris]|uniref:Lipoprotein n=1 Tax=Spiroplasma gladiatoris TaxID=2143 RepID=A0A4P7AIF1_9MOLU|nr:hypothetical protein [Spiroplasma gladiatoris]QBQ08057.1 hypothetical protein SGLAD_v1c08580 [Spiroplasma gladiatoris]
MKKIFVILSTMLLPLGASSYVIACPNKIEKRKKNIKEVEEAFQELTPANNSIQAAAASVIKKINDFFNIEVKETTDIIFSLYSRANDMSSGEITGEATSTSMLIKGKATFKLKYVDERNDIKDFIKNKDLGDWSGQGVIPTINEAINQIKLKNSEFFLSSNYFEFIGVPDKNNLEIKVKDNVKNYRGSVKFKQIYSISQDLKIQAISDKTFFQSKDGLGIDIKVTNVIDEMNLTAGSSDDKVVEVLVEKKQNTINAEKKEITFLLKLFPKNVGEVTITLNYPGADLVVFKVKVVESPDI